ncbi:hypothetical protein GMDG_05791 [Pseudogymnoascus destructans 20631-21]|uniref:Uncharacterized protein n=1 Tax=Pseudogymnoascus destructans (strain ATCC MYA-4855 / 20631-21) TaxID=658429 RepID=L8FQW2_PSED2|nr:hypothetical protein GMDG_05791 [Pseudogymnoascus destructans 20631-21]
MKLSTALLISASAALSSATGPDYNPETGKWTCHVPDAVYCAGDSLKTNIIIRCTGLVGQPGNCNDNLAGEPPLGVQPTLCYAPHLHSAACVKNCIVYGGSGNLNGVFTLPVDVCTPTPVEPTSTTTTKPEPTATTTKPEPTTTTKPEPTTTAKPTEPTTTKKPEPTTTAKPTEPTTTKKPEPTTTAKPTEPTTTKKPEPTTTAKPTEPTTTKKPPHTNKPTVVPPTTVTTNTPVGPSSTITPPIPAAAVANAASLGMVVLAAAVAFAV